MLLKKDMPLCEQREALRHLMRKQRQLIAYQFIEATTVDDAYPRSMTMRFLKQHSSAKLLAEVATMLIGARYFRSITKALALARIVKTISSKKS